MRGPERHAPARYDAVPARPAMKTTTAPPQHVEKEIPPEPPLRIVDSIRGNVYTRQGFLGEGGFARVYEVMTVRGERKAVKVIRKSTVQSRKNKTKLWAEIKLHQMLDHPNVVRFEDCFEDEEHVYMLLELCDNGSLMDVLKRRKRYTEPEARCLMVQLIGACQYLHRTNVIHRDLKLGNLFLSRDLEVKVGDLGLAALIENPGDRKKTICGTPNYIAPEVLFDTANGHSFEVDVWSVGVILYTLTVGRPPFQTKDVKAIYKRIRDNRYEFPPDKPISESAKDLIMCILDPNPESRPTLDAILRHRWFLDGEFPARIPLIALDSQPSFRNLSRSESRRNFQLVCQKAQIGSNIPIPLEPARPRTALGPSIMQQERDFKNAVQPDSPISALLHSARQPLVQAPAQIKESSLLRKLTAAGAHATLSPARRTAMRAGPSTTKRMEVLDEDEDEGKEEVLDTEEEGGYDAGVRVRELANQKARIVSQMLAKEQQRIQEEHNLVSRSPTKTAGLHPAKRVAATEPPRRHHASAPAEEPKMRTSLFDVFGSNLSLALKMGEDFRSSNIEERPSAPRVFVVSWLDYCTKYGMGFAMTDGTVSVHFNDSSSIALAPGKKYFDFVQPSLSGVPSSARRESHNADRAPRELQNKLFLTRHFETYMLERLMRKEPYVYSDIDMTTGMVYITKFLRMKHVIVFRLSNDVLQFNFYDHSKLILSQDGLVVSILDKYYVLRTWSLEQLLQPLPPDARDKDKKRREGVIHKVQYASDVLARIKSHALSAVNAAGDISADEDAVKEGYEADSVITPVFKTLARSTHGELSPFIAKAGHR